jgi:hypothetical protein
MVARVDLSPILERAKPYLHRRQKRLALVGIICGLVADLSPFWEFAAFSQPQVQSEYAPAFKRHAQNKLNGSGHQLP